MCLTGTATSILRGSTTAGLGCSSASPCGIGGAWGISSYWDADEAAFSGPTLRLTAGDDFGASPPLAGFFNEQPGVMAERMMGIQVNTFGNHNFDKGLAHLQSMIDYAGAPTDADHPGQPFRYVATNLKNVVGNLTGVDPIAYFTLGGAKVAVLGIVNEDAPTLVSPGNFGTIVITDGVEAVKKYAAIARKAGANTVIVITHKGFATVSPALTGTLVDFATALPSGLVDVVMGDHTNLQGSGITPNGVLYHENLSFGNSYAKTLLTVQPGKGGTTTAKSVGFVSPTVKPATSNGTVWPGRDGAGFRTPRTTATSPSSTPWRRRGCSSRRHSMVSSARRPRSSIGAATSSDDARCRSATLSPTACVSATTRRSGT
jgi:5'-nucleotidase